MKSHDLDKKVYEYSKAYALVGGFEIEDDIIGEILAKSNVKTEEEAVDVIEEYIYNKRQSPSTEVEGM